MDYDEDSERLIGWLEEEKAIIWDGMADDGQAMFRFDLERLKEVFPELYEDVMADIDADLMVLYENGLVEIEYDENLNALFRPTQKAVEFMEKLNRPFDN